MSKDEQLTRGGFVPVGDLALDLSDVPDELRHWCLQPGIRLSPVRPQAPFDTARISVTPSHPCLDACVHIRSLKSAECIKNGDLSGSVRESIHAVESVARRLNADAEKSLKPALDALSQKAHLHPAFKRGIENLYGYTSDEDGIRHALLGEQEKVDIDDAVFMFGACASFTAYLVNKARTAGLLKQEDDD